MSTRAQDRKQLTSYSQMETMVVCSLDACFVVVFLIFLADEPDLVFQDIRRKSKGKRTMPQRNPGGKHVL